MIQYTLFYSPEAKESISKLTFKLKRISERSFLNLSGNPYTGKKLSGKLSGLYSIRITRRYRAIYRIDTVKHIIWVLEVSHRKEIYR
ncbi:MAG: type II toxin-antitoxin system mRNA interferase toxin, RelE/StbE family [Planctomycetes bacterium]|nr:type II toxin-antitoxin system mRNA interferase toxin, RelE/StbE family [Planctomycetota bacterium]